MTDSVYVHATFLPACTHHTTDIQCIEQWLVALIRKHCTQPKTVEVDHFAGWLWCISGPSDNPFVEELFVSSDKWRFANSGEDLVVTLIVPKCEATVYPPDTSWKDVYWALQDARCLTSDEDLQDWFWRLGEALKAVPEMDVAVDLERLQDLRHKAITAPQPDEEFIEAICSAISAIKRL